MNYADIRPRLRTGDMLCWQGTGTFSRLIQVGQYGAGFTEPAWKISHIGMVVRGEDYRHDGAVLTFESTTLNEAPDVGAGRPIRGVSVVRLSEKLSGYRGRLYVRHLELPAGERPGFVTSLVEFIGRVHGRPYERKLPQLLASALPIQRGLGGEDDSTLFCSETYIEALEHAGVLDERDVDADAICPAECALIEGYAGLREGVRFSGLVEVES